MRDCLQPSPLRSAGPARFASHSADARGGRLRVRNDAQENSFTAKPGIRPDNDCVPGTYAYGHAAAQVGGEVAERIFP